MPTTCWVTWEKRLPSLSLSLLGPVPLCQSPSGVPTALSLQQTKVEAPLPAVSPQGLAASVTQQVNTQMNEPAPGLERTFQRVLPGTSWASFPPGGS